MVLYRVRLWLSRADALTVFYIPQEVISVVVVGSQFVESA